MLCLPTTTDSLELVLGAAQTSAAMHVATTYRDITSTTFTPGETVAVSNGTTPVTIAAAPGAASTQRLIDFVSVYNNDTAAKQVTIRRNLNSTIRTLISVSLGVGETLLYLDAVGWQVLTNNGSVKHAQVQGSNQVTNNRQVAVLGADVTNNNGVANTIADVTGLSFPVVSGKTYWFRFVIDYTAAATTTGSRWSINGPTTSRLSYRSEYSLTTTSRTVNEGVTAYDSPAASNATSATTGANLAIIEGFIIPTADGTVIARFASEVLSSAIVAKAGSIVEYQQLN